MNTQQWKWFKLGDKKLFVIKKGKRLTKADMIEGNIRYIGATDGNVPDEDHHRRLDHTHTCPH